MVNGRKSLKSLLQTGNLGGEDEYESLRQPQAKEVAYESKSGGIISKIEEMKDRIADSSIKNEGQTSHDDRFGYGILHAPGLVLYQPTTKVSSESLSGPLLDYAPTRTTSVAPDSSTKADLKPRAPASRITAIQELNASTRL